jgi:hypothetical protein
MSRTAVADFVQFLHILLVVFVVVIPFWKKASWTVLLLHSVTCLSLVLHWWANEDTCFLTLIESSLRGISRSRSFIHSIVSPLYKIDDVNIRKFSLTVTPVLACITFLRFVNNWKLVKQETKFLFSSMERIM